MDPVGKCQREQGQRRREKIASLTPSSTSCYRSTAVVEQGADEGHCRRLYLLLYSRYSSNADLPNAGEWMRLKPRCFSVLLGSYCRSTPNLTWPVIPHLLVMVSIAINRTAL